MTPMHVDRSSPWYLSPLDHSRRLTPENSFVHPYHVDSRTSKTDWKVHAGGRKVRCRGNFIQLYPPHSLELWWKKDCWYEYLSAWHRERHTANALLPNTKMCARIFARMSLWSWRIVIWYVIKQSCCIHASYHSQLTCLTYANAPFAGGCRQKAIALPHYFILHHCITALS